MPSVVADHSKSRLATRLCFVAAGFGVACWAPLVPFAKSRLGIGDGTLGVLLLCLGAGSVAAMPITGILATRLGSKPIILAGGFGMALFLPLLAFVDHPVSLAAALLMFGASLGSLDVAMNLHAVQVERALSRPLMSGFHALFSIGGFAGSGFMTLMLSSHISPFHGVIIAAVVVALAISAAAPHLLRVGGEKQGPLFVLPHGIVLVIALLAFIAFLVEGALLDWSALLLVTTRMLPTARAGIGYMLFSIAMTAGRLTGDRAIAQWGDRKVFLLSGLTAVLGFALVARFELHSPCPCRFRLYRTRRGKCCSDPLSASGNPTANACSACSRGSNLCRICRPTGGTGIGGFYGSLRWIAWSVYCSRTSDVPGPSLEQNCGWRSALAGTMRDSSVV